MSAFLAMFSGVLIAVMIQINGGLFSLLGPWHSTVIIHLVGLVGGVIFLIVRRAPLQKSGKIPWYLYFGGTVGVATVVLNNATTITIGVLATISLGFLGQIILSVLIEQKGLFGTPRRPMSLKKMCVIFIIAAGVLIMQLWGAGSQNPQWLMMLFALISGGSIVFNRLLNSGLGQKIGVLPSTLANYITGLATSFIILLILREPPPAALVPATAQQALLYTGGLLGLIVVIISSIVTPKIPSLQLTLYLFVSQLCAGMLLDYLFFANFSASKLVGGLFVLIGLVLNQLIEKQYLRAGKHNTP